VIHKFYLFLFCFSLVLSVQVPLNAQQAIINLPSADITPKNKLFVMNESQRLKANIIYKILDDV
jgi:hypothetical protein